MAIWKAQLAIQKPQQANQQSQVALEMANETSKVSKEAIFLEQSCRKLEKGKKRNTSVEKKI